MIKRRALDIILGLAKGYPFIAIRGPRQAGKTTLSRMAFPDKPYVSGGDKGSQNQDIKQAKDYWRVYLTHEKI